MLQWISTNLSTILICIVLLAIVILIIRSLIRQKKQGKSSCGAGCAHCAMHGAGISRPISPIPLLFWRRRHPRSHWVRRRRRSF